MKKKYITRKYIPILLIITLFFLLVVFCVLQIKTEKENAIFLIILAGILAWVCWREGRKLFHYIDNYFLLLSSAKNSDFWKSTNFRDSSSLDPEIEEYKNEINHTMQKKYGEAIVSKQLQYRVLQNQINPHFLYNTLEAIRAQALIEGSEDVADMVETLSKYYRYSVGTKKEMVSFRDEIDNIRNYFQILRFRFENRFLLELKVEDEDIYDALIPKMTLQPIVENAVFHGLDSLANGGQVLIRIFHIDTDIVVFVSDNGCGIPFSQVVEMNHCMVHAQSYESSVKQHTSKDTGIALDNVNTRILLRYGHPYGVRIYSTVGRGTDVCITIPYQTELQ